MVSLTWRGQAVDGGPRIGTFRHRTTVTRARIRRMTDTLTTAGVIRPTVATTVRPNAALALLCVAQLMLVLDFSIVNVALPSMHDDLGFSRGGLQWVISAYALTFGGFLMLGGRAADLFGRRRVFVAGLVLFSVASLAGGFAWAPWVLVAARAVQGIGGAIVSPAALSLLTTTFPEGPQRNRAMGWFGTMSTIGFAVGMMLGGVLTHAAGWPWVMFVNVPVGLAVILLAPLALPAGREAPPSVGFDFLGAALVTGASAALVYALSDASEAGWGSIQTIALLATSAALFVGFVVAEGRVRHPLVPLSIFRRRDLVGANLVGFLLAAAAPSMVYLLTLHMQQQLGYSPALTGLAFMPHAAVAIVAARVVPRSVDRFGARATMAAGAAIFGAGLLMLTLLTPGGPYAIELLPGLALTPIGILFGFLASMIAATSGMPDEEQGLASGLLATSQQIGSALGLAVVLNVVSALERRAVLADVAAASARVIGYRYGFLVEAAFAAAAVAVALLVVRNTPRGTPVGARPVVAHH
jgi:EmrB/QacA subfamily drug resistance transporter